MRLLINNLREYSVFEKLVRPRIEETKEGFFIIKNDSHSGKDIRESGVLGYDHRILEAVLPLTPINATVIDCGSMYGGFTGAMQNHLSYMGTIISIDPGMIAMECLKNNCPQSRCRNILLNCALGEKHDTWTRYKITDDRGSSLVNNNDITGDNIRGMSIDGILKDLCIDRVHLIKMKCQGWEYRILKGSHNTLEDLMPILVMEINHAQLKLHGGSFKEIKELLDYHYYVYKIIEPNLTEDAPEFNILCQCDPLSILDLDFYRDFIVGLKV